jgi:hypothetical protein
MVKINITMDNNVLLQFQTVLARFGEDNFPLTASAVAGGADRIAKLWRAFAAGGSLKGVEPLERPNREYVLGVKVERMGPFDHEIYNDTKAARRIDEGSEQLDMKTTHPYGPKSRISKKGVPYLIVPFRWGTPRAVGFRNIMPEQVYNMVKKFKKMKTMISADSLVNAKVTPNGGYATYNVSKNPKAGARMVGRAQYHKGYDRLSGMDVTGTLEAKTRMNGMVRVHDTLGKNKAAGYLTFRVISAASPASNWVRKRIPPRHVIPALVDESLRAINEAVEEAVMRDLQTYDFLSE